MSKKFLKAAVDNDVNALQLEIEKGVDINIRFDVTGETALQIAAGRGHLESVRFLINDQQASVNIPNRNGHTPLHSAVLMMLLKELKSEEWNRYSEIVSILVSHGADVNANTYKGYTVFDYFKGKPANIKDPIMSLLNPHKMKQSNASQAGNSHSVFHSKTELRRRHTTGNTSESSTSNHNSYDACPPNSVNMDENTTEKSSLLVSSGHFSDRQIKERLSTNAESPKSEGNDCIVM